MLVIIVLFVYYINNYCDAEITYIEAKNSLKGHKTGPGSPWPLPRSWTRTSTQLTLSPETFELKSSLAKKCDVIEEALLRYRGIIFTNPFVPVSPHHKELDSIKVTIQDESCGYPKQADDEHYILNIPNYGSSGTIKAKKIWGALRGLETFSQLVYQHPITGHYLVNGTTIEDWPRFSYRGIHIDTGRHFLPVNLILKNLEAMEYNKFNVLHWHVSDDQSYPLESKTYPNLTQLASFSPDHVYTVKDVQNILQNARLRGIRVIPEIDTPGHTQSFGKAFPKLLTACYVGDEPFQAKPNVHSEAEMLNPSRNYTYQFFRKLFIEMKTLFKDDYIHLGADEVHHDCWKSNPEIREFMSSEGLKDYNELEQYYIRRTIKNVADIGYKYMIWQDPIDKGLQVANDTIVQVWKDFAFGTYYTRWQDYVKDYTKKKLQIVVSGCWYLNMISYGEDWKKYYECDPRNFDGSAEDKEYVIGGEACVWSEFIDQTNFLARVWPRASAVAERLWSHPKDTNNSEDAQFRLDEHRCRMMRRGIPASPIGPGYCGKIDVFTSNGKQRASDESMIIAMIILYILFYIID